MFISANQIKDITALIEYIVDANEENSEWTLKYTSSGFYFRTEDALLESAVSHYLETV